MVGGISYGIRQYYTCVSIAVSSILGKKKKTIRQKNKKEKNKKLSSRLLFAAYNLPGRVRLVFFSVRAHEPLERGKFKGLHVNITHPMGGGWIDHQVGKECQIII